MLTGDNYNIERNDYGGPKENEVTIYVVPNFKMEISSGLWAINPERSESALQVPLIEQCHPWGSKKTALFVTTSPQRPICFHPDDIPKALENLV